MYKIVKKKSLNPTVTLMEIDAPLIAKKAEPGQFIILRVDENGERIPLTVAGYDREAGTVRIIFQIVGATTEKLNHLNEGDYIHDFVGPLGVPTHTDGLKKVCVVGGGVGCAIALPVAEKLHEIGCEVHSIVGFRNKDLVILEDEFKACSDKFILMTDDGSYGQKGVVTAPLEDGSMAAQAMTEAVKDAGIKPENIDYINAHGTSTKLNDKGETNAIKKAFGEHAYKLAVSSTKSMTGHMLGAAGAVEAIASVMTLKTGIIAPTIHYEQPDEDCDLNYVPNQAVKADVTLAISDSLGFGGHNGCIAFSKLKD